MSCDLIVDLNDRLIENRGASIRDHTSARIENENKKDSHRSVYASRSAC